MRVKKLELIGFKSFADRTEIHLGEGVTCIVGPNGCGKSNISDAIRWVFGERSAKLLRGTRMEDVIFNGTDFRKPTGMAEISITVENGGHQLPIEYDEVVFTRRLYRSGQSEYFLNRTPCRLRDILGLILDTGMGSSSYSMIEQGRVDSVIQASPEERRSLIEEAAGISKYKVKKEEALRKLERTEQNLLRIRDIAGEVQKNIQYAERQARRAERYKTEFEKLKRLEIQKAFLELSELDRQKKNEGVKKEELLRSLESIESELEEILKIQEDHNTLLQQILGEESLQSTRCFELRSQYQAVIQKQGFNRERLQETQRRRTEVEKEQEILSLNIAELEKEVHTKSLEYQKADGEHREAKALLEKEGKRFDEGDTRLRQRKEEGEKLKKLLFENASALTLLRNDTNRLRTLLEANGRDQIRRRETSEKLLLEKTAVEKKRISYQEEISGITRELEETNSEREGVFGCLSEAKEKVLSLSKTLEEARAKFQELTSRLKLLRELEETSQEVERKLLASVSRDPLRGKLVRSLREVLHIENGYESAVEAVLGSFAKGLIAEDLETAKGLMMEMAQSHMGPCGIFIRNLVKPNGKHANRRHFFHPQVRHAVEEVVKIHSGLEPLFKPLFENVFVVEDFSPKNLGELLPLAQEVKLVTKQGILLGPEARIFFRNGKLSPDQGPFQRETEINLLNGICEELASEIGVTASKKKEAESEASALEQESTSLEERGREASIRKNATELLVHGLAERLAVLDEELRVTRFEMTESDQESSRLRKQILELEEKLAGLEDEEKRLLECQTRLESSAADFQQERDSQIHSVADLKARVDHYQERIQELFASESLLRTQIENSKNRTIRLQQETGELLERLQNISAEDIFLDKEKGKLEFEQLEAESVLSEIRGRKAFREEGVRQHSAQAKEKEESLRKLQSGLHEEELKAMDLSYREQGLFQRLEQTYSAKLAELRPEDYLQGKIDRASLESEIDSLKKKLEAFGPVNLLAVEEYEELKHRHDFLSGQEKDLNEARESLLEAIRKINRTTKTLFGETFTKAQSLFQEYYGILFGGGHAELILMEGEEGQEAGVDIMVRPPGKKPQHISLLSGGEKALTAMALLFALFRIKPSPLCVLDEVDAPLDEANIDRFLNVLRAFLGSTQFLIVTHNRKTIAMGDFLYGVTMEESGVSKIVSVEVAHSEEKLTPA